MSSGAGVAPDEPVVDRLALWRRDPVRDVSRHADRIRARCSGDIVHDHLHAEGFRRHDCPERLRGNGLHHLAVDSAVHIERRGHRTLAGGSRSLRCVARLDALDSWRARDRQRVRLRIVRGNGWLLAGHLLGDRLRRHPGDAKARLLPRICLRDHRSRRHARHPAAAVDHHDPLCGRRRAVARAAFPRRHRASALAGRALRRLRDVEVPARAGCREAKGTSR